MNSSDCISPAASELCELLRSDAFSGVTVVNCEGRALLEFAGGFADRQAGRAIRLDTRFGVASMSKMFTAVCIARLVDAGLCEFEKPVVEIVPALRPHFGPEFSLGLLLSHRSGLGEYHHEESLELVFDGLDVARLDCPQAFMPLVLKAPRFSPGEFRYSSAGYILLGLAIETLTGLQFSDAIAKWVIEPAELRATGFPSLENPPENFAVGYLSDGRPNVGHLPHIGGPDGGIITNAADLQQFFACLRNGALLGDSSRQFLLREVSRMSDAESYGHGFKVIRSGGCTWFGHTGSDPGVSAMAVFSIQPESSIIILCNRRSVAFRVFQLILQWLPLDIRTAQTLDAESIQ